MLPNVPLQERRSRGSAGGALLSFDHQLVILNLDRRRAVENQFSRWISFEEMVERVIDQGDSVGTSDGSRGFLVRAAPFWESLPSVGTVNIME